MSLPRIVVGDGPTTVVVVNGGNAFVSRFDERRARRDAERLRPLFPWGTRLCLIGYDPGATGPWNVTSVANTVATVLEVEHPGAVVAGVSFGGLVALRLAVERPDLVDRLILLATAHRFSAEGQRRVRAQVAHLAAGDVDAMMRPFLSLFRRPWLILLLRLTFPLKRRSVLAGLNRPELAIGLLQAALDESGTLASRLGEVRADTLLVAGSRDQFFDVEAMREMALVMPSARLVLLERETHMVPLERRRDVAAAVARFLERGDRGDYGGNGCTRRNGGAEGS
jgi:pimeloyl-ACP methyl ester carboxylesterase